MTKEYWLIVEVSG